MLQLHPTKVLSHKDNTVTDIYISLFKNKDILTKYKFLNPLNEDDVYNKTVNNVTEVYPDYIAAAHVSLITILDKLKLKNLNFKMLADKILSSTATDEEKIYYDEIINVTNLEIAEEAILEILPYSIDEFLTFHNPNIEYKKEYDLNTCTLNNVCISNFKNGVEFLNLYATLNKKEVALIIYEECSAQLISDLRVYGNNPLYDNYFISRACAKLLSKQNNIGNFSVDQLINNNIIVRPPKTIQTTRDKQTFVSE